MKEVCNSKDSYKQIKKKTVHLEVPENKKKNEQNLDGKR